MTIWKNQSNDLISARNDNPYQSEIDGQSNEIKVILPSSLRIYLQIQIIIIVNLKIMVGDINMSLIEQVNTSNDSTACHSKENDLKKTSVPSTTQKFKKKSLVKEQKCN